MGELTLETEVHNDPDTDPDDRKHEEPIRVVLVVELLRLLKYISDQK